MNFPNTLDNFPFRYYLPNMPTIYPEEIKERAYIIWKNYRANNNLKRKSREIARKLVTDLKFGKKQYPKLDFSKITHKTIAYWVENSGWERRYKNETKKKAFPTVKVNKSIIPDEVIETKEPDEEKKETRDPAFLTAKDLTRELLVEDLKEVRLSQMAIRRKLLRQMGTLARNIRLEDDHTINAQNYVYMSNISMQLKNLNKDMEYTDSLLGVPAMLSEEQTQELREEQVITDVIALPKRRRDYIVSCHPTLLEHPKIRALYPDGVPVKLLED